MMAADFRWYDQLVDRGWLYVLSPAALRLLMAMGRWTDRKPMRTRASPERLRAAARLAPRTFRAALAEVVAHRLVTVETVSGRRWFFLALPVPPRQELAATAVEIGHAAGRRLHSAWQISAAQPLRKAGQTRQSDEAPQKTKQEDHLGRPEGKAEVERALRQQVALRLEPFLAGGLSEDDFREVVRAAHVVMKSPDRLEQQAFSLSRALQAKSVLMPELQVRELLRDGAALLGPMVGGGSAPQGEIVRVQPLVPDVPQDFRRHDGKVLAAMRGLTV
jgi:hypothetical protein